MSPPVPGYLQDYVLAHGAIAGGADSPFFLTSFRKPDHLSSLGWENLAHDINVLARHVGDRNLKVKQPSQHDPLRARSLVLQQGALVDPAGKFPSKQASISPSSLEHASRFHE